MKLTVWIIVWIMFWKNSSMVPTDLDCNPVIRIEQGLVKGTCLTTLFGDKFHVFRGIPYGKPPVGQLRFQAPQPAESWTGIFDATKDCNICPQIFSDGKVKFTGDEDCLRLYVFSHPISRYNQSLPVLVYIHGGAVLKGSATSIDFKPRRLMSNKDLPIILVAMQYRLSCLGFLSTGDSASPGNYGALDQLLSLRWVQNNIRQFGGDPNRVTIVGDSAGGLSALTHLVSEKASGLFRAVATFSGALDFNMDIQNNPLVTAKHFGSSVSCKSYNTTILVDCLRRKTAKELTLAAHALSVSAVVAFPFWITLENSESAQYLKKHPEQLFKEGNFIKVPVMMGTTKDETSMVFRQKYISQIQYLAMIKVPMLTEIILFNIFLPFLTFTFLKFQTNLHALSYAVKRIYESEYNFNDRIQLLQFLVDMSTDAVFRAQTDKLARAITSQGISTYIYTFEFHGDLSSRTDFGDKVIGHIENLQYLIRDYLTPKDSEMSSILCSHLLNFVYYLDPTPGDKQPKWMPTHSARDLDYLRYGDDEIVMKKGYFTDKMDFWRTQVPKIVSQKRYNGSTVPGLLWL